MSSTSCSHGIQMVNNSLQFMNSVSPWSNSQSCNYYNHNNIAGTTDVQYVSLCPHAQLQGFYSIRCHFVEATFARGCQYNLVSTAGVQNLTGYIDRLPSSSTAVYTLWMNIGYFSNHRLFAYDWESDGSTGNIAVSRRKTCT